MAAEVEEKVKVVLGIKPTGANGEAEANFE